MTTVFTIASGKGGTGKTTVTANLGSMLAYHKEKTYILDSDMGIANLGLALGLENMPITLHEVLAGKADIHEAIYDGPFGVSVIPSGLSLEGFKSSDPGYLKDVYDLKSRMEFSDNEIEILAEAVRGISGIK